MQKHFGFFHKKHNAFLGKPVPNYLAEMAWETFAKNCVESIPRWNNNFPTSPNIPASLKGQINVKPFRVWKKSGLRQQKSIASNNFGCRVTNLRLFQRLAIHVPCRIFCIFRIIIFDVGGPLLWKQLLGVFTKCWTIMKHDDQPSLQGWPKNKFGPFDEESAEYLLVVPKPQPEKGLYPCQVGAPKTWYSVSESWTIGYVDLPQPVSSYHW